MGLRGNSRIWNKLPIFLIFLLLIFPLVNAQTATEKINSIITFAEDYEMGRISYLQMRVHSAVIREEVRALAGATGFVNVDGRTEPVGLTQEKVEEIFGKPTEMTDWVWMVNEWREVRIEEPMPRWEKIVFDGKKMQVTFNAWPQIVKLEDGSSKKVYWVDFDIKFKKKFDFDLNGMISEIKSLGENFKETLSGAEELAGKMAEYRSILQGYIDQNKGDCLHTIEGFFSSEEKQKEQQILRWNAVLAKEKGSELILELNICDRCEWPWVDLWFRMEYRGPPEEGPKFEEIVRGEFEKEKYKDKSIEELEAMLEEKFKEVVESAKGKDTGRFGSAMAELRAINKALEEASYWDERTRQENFERRKAHLKRLISTLPDFKEEAVKEVRFEKRLVEDLVERKNKFCREISKTECSSDEGCYNGKCIYAIGGKEDCSNKVDDDGDNVIDCNDPDCARECGKICKPVCEPECWPCNNRECGNICKECWECRGEGCEGVCKECWPCTEEKCKTKPFCAECKACEDSLWEKPEEECDSECKLCRSCVEKKEAGDTEVTCGELCQKCEECRLPGGNQQCIAACNEIGKISPSEISSCKKLCEDEVIFFCGTNRQNYPCKDTTYICEGKPQYLPCFVYECEGKKQTVPCTEEAMCGLNQFLSIEDKQCKCQAGYYDCDKDNNCESDKPCKEGGEVCNNKEDDDGDYLVDCADLADCRMGRTCANNKVCFEGKCVPSEEVNMSALCPKPDEEYFEGECIKKCPAGYEKDEQGVCKPVIIVCPEGYELKEGICVPTEGNVTCPDGFKPSPEKPGECVPIVVECPEGYKLEDEQCIPMPVNVTCEEGYILEEGGCVPIVTECPEGYKLENNICVPELTNVTECPEGQKLTSNGECVPIEVECPEGYEKNEEGVCVPKGIVWCPIGFILIRDECLPKVEECPVGYKLEEGRCVPETPPVICIGDYVLKEGKCVPIIFECPENYKLKEGVCVPVMVSCPEGERLVEDSCVPERCPEGEKFEEGKCVPLKKEEEDELRNTGEECTLESDCSGVSDICSNGVCKELPPEAIAEKPPEEKREAPPETPEIPEGYEMPEAEKELEIPEGYKVPEEEGFKGEEIPGYEITEKTGEEAKPEEKPPAETPPEAAPEGGFLFIDRITGFFSKNLLGFYFKRGDKCSSDEDCNPNQNCAPTGECHCKRWEGWFDCNGDGDGYDQDGCESNDPTCGGRQEACPWGCRENQFCNEKRGDCECNPGFFECDGDWFNGCESTVKCKECESNEDCAPKRCVEWNENMIIEFGCYEEKGWIEEKGAIVFSAGCNFHPTGKVDGYMGFDAWGETFEQVGLLERQMGQQNRPWCQFELESLEKERKELEASMNEAFLKWFFEDYVNKDTANWEKHISGIFDAYWKFVDNSQRTAMNIKCLGKNSFPEDYAVIGPIEYESEFGHVKFWEERMFADEFGVEMLSPYMQIWVFPPKEFIKDEMKKAAAEGRIPGPPEESQPGPTPAELSQIRQDAEMMKFINDISSKYGGSAETLISIVDKGEPVFNVVMTINPDVLIDVRPVKEFAGTADIKVNVDFDFVYEMISMMEKRMTTERPPWDKKFRVGEGIKNVMTAGKIFAKVSGGIATGSIKIEPLSALPDALKLLSFMFGTEGPKGPEEG